MEKGNRGFINRVKWIYKLTKHGLFWHGVRNNLAKIGIDFMPYYHFVGIKENAKPFKVRGMDKYLELSIFDKKDIELIKSTIIGIEQKDFFKDLRDGDICLGLKNGSEIVAYSFIKNKPFYFRKCYFFLGKEDIYLHSLYVFNKYRGRNIASYMKYKIFEVYEKLGVKYHHTIVEYFNKAALKVQYRANSRIIALYLSVQLFKKWTFNYTLKKFN